MDGFDAKAQRYVLRVFIPGAKPKIAAGPLGRPPASEAKLRRDCFVVPKGVVLQDATSRWQPSLRHLA